LAGDLDLPPQTLFAAAAAPSWSFSRLLHAFLWLWVHTLQFGLANQTLPQAIAEDVINNPYRPIPTGRISARMACILRWMTIPLCLLLSAANGPRTIFASFLGSLYILAYNEGGGARSHWLVRSVLNAVGYTLAKAGATLCACTCVYGIGPVLLGALTARHAPTGQREKDADSIVCIAIALSAGIILTTIHMQDFKDVVGDATVGRVTLPIAYPVLSRVATAFVLVAWSWGVSRTWWLDDVTAAAMGVSGMTVGISFVARRDAHADKVSFYMYSVSHHPGTTF